MDKRETFVIAEDTINQLVQIAQEHPDYFLIISQKGNILSGLDAKSGSIMLTVFATKELAVETLKKHASNIKDDSYYILTVKDILKMTNRKQVD